MNPYVLDSNFFIQAHRANYPFDVVPSFWSKIKDLADRGLIISIDKVKEEIYRNDDELSSWCQKELPSNFFRDSSIAISEYATLVKWANSRNDHFQPRAIEGFLATDSADAWIIAFAMNHKYPVLTHEKSEPERKNKIKMPDVCLYHGVSYCTTVEMLRNLKETI